ncbi:unnamed protein product, partial [Discosporangium mesarthrocarpum]
AANNQVWGGVSALCMLSPVANEEESYKKSIALQLHLFSWELPDTVLVLTRSGTLFVLGTPKKCAFVQEAAGSHFDDTINVITLTRDKGDANAAHHAKILEGIREGNEQGDLKIGMLLKESFTGPMASGWLEAVKAAGVESVDISPGLGLILAVKDPVEQENVKRAAILTNKVMKRGFVEKMQDVIEHDTNITHEALAQEVDDIIEKPSLIQLNVADGLVESCFFPIVQSGGDYDLKPSAQSTSDNLKYDIIVCNMGARYKSYCASMARSFFVDPPRKVQSTYRTLLALYSRCLDELRPGKQFREVVEAAHRYLDQKAPILRPHLVRNLGFSLGLDYRDSSMLISSKNHFRLKEGMVLNLSVGLQGVPLSSKDRQGTNMAMETFSVMIADTVIVKEEGNEVWTKHSKEWSDVSYNLADTADNQADDTNYKENVGTAW